MDAAPNARPPLGSPSPLTSSGPEQAAAGPGASSILSPLVRFDAAIGDTGTGLTVAQWLVLAAALSAEAFAHEPASESSRKRMDRAAHCRHRAIHCPGRWPQ